MPVGLWFKNECTAYEKDVYLFRISLYLGSKLSPLQASIQMARDLFMIRLRYLTGSWKMNYKLKKQWCAFASFQSQVPC